MEMLQLCPRDDVERKIIGYMFLLRLPLMMQSMLGEDDTLSCDIFALCTSSAERLRDLDLSINKTLQLNDPVMFKF